MTSDKGDEDMSVERAERREERPRGVRIPAVFIPARALALGGIVLIGLMTTVLVFINPWIGVPVGAGVAVSGFLFTLYKEMGDLRARPAREGADGTGPSGPS